MPTRRAVIASVGTTATIGLGGCMGTSPDSGENKQQARENQSYTYYFRDKSGTLNQAGDEQIPEEASENQIIVNERNEEEWEQLQLNDYELIERHVERGTEFYITEENFQQIQENTIEIFNEIKQTGTHGTRNYEDLKDAEIFTISLLEATNQSTEETLSGPDQSHIVQLTADYILEQSSIEINEYNLHGNVSMIGDPGLRDDGFKHPLGVLTWQEDGEAHVRYAETEQRNTELVNKPQESFYGSSLEQDTFEGRGGVEYNPENWAGPLDYQKTRTLEKQNDNIGNGTAGGLTAVSLIHYVDDASWRGWGITDGVDLSAEGLSNFVVSDSFGRSVQDFSRNPGEEYSLDEFQGAARALYSAIEQDQTANNYALTGTLSNPEIHKTDKETIEKIHEERKYDEVKQEIGIKKG